MGWNVSVDVRDAVELFACVEGVAYADKDNDKWVLVPHYTLPKAVVVDCTIFDSDGNVLDPRKPVRTERLGEPFVLPIGL